MQLKQIFLIKKNLSTENPIFYRKYLFFFRKTNEGFPKKIINSLILILKANIQLRLIQRRFELIYLKCRFLPMKQVMNRKEILIIIKSIFLDLY